MQLRDVISISAGTIIGWVKLFHTQDVLGAVTVAACTGAAAWIGQTIAKELWNICKPTFKKLFKKRKNKST